MWQPIDTAPTDSSVILVNWKSNSGPGMSEVLGMPEVAYFGINHPNQKGKTMWRSANHGNKLETPDVWMPIPGVNFKHWTA